MDIMIKFMSMTNLYFFMIDPYIISFFKLLSLKFDILPLSQIDLIPFLAAYISLILRGSTGISFGIETAR